MIGMIGMIASSTITTGCQLREDSRNIPQIRGKAVEERVYGLPNILTVNDAGSTEVVRGSRLSSISSHACSADGLVLSLKPLRRTSEEV